MAMNDLRELRAIPVTVGNRKIWVSTHAGEDTKKLFDALKIKLPTKILKIEETAVVVNTKSQK